MKKRLISTALALCLCVSMISNAHALKDQSAGGVPAAGEAVWSDADPCFTEETPETTAGNAAQMFSMARAGETYPTYEQAYKTMVGLKDKYPEGMTWTNFEPYGSNGWAENYRFKGGAIKGGQYGVGCAAFCFVLSDEVFGSVPAYVYDAGSFTFENIRVGDFLRVDNSHFVTVLRITSSGVILTEGNYNGTVHWGRAISKNQLMVSANFLVTRYPKTYSENEEETIVAQGQEPGKNGTLNWTISSKHVLTITGSGAMEDYTQNDKVRPSWEKAESSVYSVDIGSGITSVGAYAFQGRTDLVSASLPSTIASIGAGAFYGSNIVGIAIPGSVKSVGNDAFRNCASLTSVDIAEGVETIGERAFHSCIALGYVDFPKSLTSLGAGAFTSCENLKQVRFMRSSKSLAFGNGAFTQCWNLEFVSLPEGITELPPGAFSSCKTIIRIYIPESVTTLGQAGKESPFLSSYVGTVYFGGTQSKWDVMMNSLENAGTHKFSTYEVLSHATVECEKSDPFVPDANDPGDIHFCENGTHYGPLENGVCQNCGETVNHTHSWSDSWSSDETGHWHECTASGCTVTGQKGDYAAHVYDDDTDTICNICGYTRTISSGDDPGDNPVPGHTHNWSNEWNNDTTHHWHECTAPGCTVTADSEKGGYAAHDYDDDTDTTCNTCGHTRTISGGDDPGDDPVPDHTHEWAEEWSKDTTYHWHECTASDCTVTDNSEKDGYAAHDYDDDADTTCNTCGYTRTISGGDDPGDDPVPDHTHEWAEEWSKDTTYHWHECTASDCTVTDSSQKDGYAAHDYDDDADTTCSTCGYTRTISGGDDPGDDPVPDHTHNWAEEWNKNSAYHWHECMASDCTVTGSSQKDGYAAHVYDGDTDTTCNICGYVRTVSSDSGFSSDNSSDGGSSNNTGASANRNPDSPSTTKTENTTIETTKNPDGSQTVVETRTDGTVIVSETDAEGNKTETVTNPDGSSITAVMRKDGVTASVTTSASGQTEAEIKLPAATVREAQRGGEAITLPIQGVRAAQDTASAPAVTVKTGSTQPVKVEIPVENVTFGTVAVIVRADGSEEIIRTTVPTESGIAVSLPDGTTVKIVDNSKSFADVPTAHWASNAINFASARELFSGTAAATFNPDAPMTRAMLMTVLARYAGEDTNGGTVWYEKGMEWAAANGISDGSNPNGNISREQLVTIFWRYSGSPAANSTLSAFADAGEISGYAQGAMCWAVEKGIISGYGNDQLNPKGQVTRAEVAAVLMRYSSDASAAV